MSNKVPSESILGGLGQQTGNILSLKKSMSYSLHIDINIVN